MSIRPFRDIKRRVTKVINVGKVKIGGDNPISVQSMTNTLTRDVKNTLKQINNISEVGGDIVRVSCPDEESTSALKEIKMNKRFSSYYGYVFYIVRINFKFVWMKIWCVTKDVQLDKRVCPAYRECF